MTALVADPTRIGHASVELLIMRRWGIASAIVLLTAALLAPSADAGRGTTPLPTAVIALVDSGINPYHDAFADRSSLAKTHPSTYLPGFPRSAKALHLTLDEPDFWVAVHKDCKIWSGVKRGELYWIPGTKIIGAITFDPPGRMPCGSRSFPEGRILDGVAHGTMTASRAVGNGYGACPKCRVVAVQGPGRRSIEWAADNSRWIDVQSNSWGPQFPLWDPAGAGATFWNAPRFVAAVEDTARRHLSLWATGNGIGTRFGLVGHPTPLDPRMTPSIVMVGGHDSGYVNLWPNFPPHVVSDSCDSWAAYHDHTSRSAETLGSGTSAATPFAAGGAARMLIEARRILGDGSIGIRNEILAGGPAGRVGSGPLEDGEFTLAEWKELLFKTATERPKRQEEDGSVCDVVAGLGIYASTPIQWEQVPEQYPEYLHIGYGAVDRPAVKVAFQVLHGQRPTPNRDETDAFFEKDRIIREQSHAIFRD